MQRAQFLAGTATGIGALLATGVPSLAQTDETRERLAELEKHTGGRLGVFAIDTHDGRRIVHRVEERFPMCSTFKFLAVSAVLSRVDSGVEHLGRHIAYTKADLLAYAPVTTANVHDGYMTVEALCEAAIVDSDNTAANLLLGTMGGPPAVTRFARALGDTRTRLDRTEPALNSAIPGDPRDTTTPASMAHDLQAVLLGNALTAASRARLETWMIGCRTGVSCIRAGVPKTWIVGDKTGSGVRGTRNDIAILKPPNRGAIVVTAYLTGATIVDGDARDAALATVGSLVSTTLA